MSHEIEHIDGKAQFAYAGEEPWHGLGTKVPADLSPEQMLQAAGLDWKVNTKPCYTRIGDRYVRIDRQTLVRDTDDKVLDVISNDWEPLQNEAAFAFFNNFVEMGDMSMETAGSLKGGRLVFGLAKINDGFSLFGGKDTVEGYLHFTNPHVYGRSIDIRFTPIRVVCWNTLTLSLNTKSRSVVKWDHRKKFDEELAKEQLGIAKEKLQSYKEAAQFLSTKRYKDEDVVDYFKRIFPATGAKATDDTISRNAKLLKNEILETQPGAEYGAGTFWQLFNAVTFATDHVLGRSQETRLESAWYGNNQVLKTKALETAVEMANAA